MTKFRHLTVEELLFHAEDAARRSPLIEELVHRLRFLDEDREIDQKNDGCEQAQCPVCEAELDINTFADESRPTITKASI